LEDQRADWERVKDTVKDKLGTEPGPPDIELLRELPRIIREGRGPISLFLHGDRVLGMMRDGGKGPYGIALDVGTTTVVGYLLDLQEGRELAVASTLNLQSEFGHDVMSRITYAQMNGDGLETLHARGIASINRVIDELAHKAGVSPSDIYHLAVVGNTCMHHFLLQLDPGNIGLSPYVPVLSGPHIEVAGRLGLRVNPAAMVDFLPNIAGFVGADTVAVLLTTMIQESSEICVALDIGTNGEIAMGSREGVLTCSTAAGPAFEGAKIRYGMRASSGAIHHIHVDDGALVCETINGEPPRGICGSGLIDAAALLLNHGLMDETGRILTTDQMKGEDLNFLKERLYENDGSRGFILAYAHESSIGEPVLLTQEDVRELQLAKGAIFAGIRILEKELAVSDEQIHKVYLAGAFGSFLNPASAMRIGLIPPMPLKKVVSIGNAAGHGARLAMLSAREMERASELAASVGYLELSMREDFQDQFISAINFPTQM